MNGLELVITAIATGLFVAMVCVSTVLVKNFWEHTDIKSTTIARNFYKTELDSIKNYDENVRQEMIAELERRKTTKEYKIFERCMEKAGL